ncbi:hypothetical protein B4U80_10368 [Leptotrombidium deliense]|uniref:Uncharacterized protein n=1 Tax=Leptotrombidium deliense TaxID=299467 RepID=A0A443SHB5_9ACAR|nr:hypothetical protein B4U80_10368 [Leptotrombidium deliense]
MTYRPHFKLPVQLQSNRSISEKVASYFQTLESIPKRCKLPLNIDPFDDFVKQFLKVKHLNCKQDFPLTYVDYENGTLLYTEKGLESELICYYRWIFRGMNDLHLYYTKLKYLRERGAKFSNKRYVVEVKCFTPTEGNTSSTPVYTNIHFWIPDFDFEQRQALKRLPDTPSVFILVVESLSGLSFRRFMNKTKKALTELGDTIIFNGILKVGLNSFPNSMALIAGNSMLNVSYDKNYWDHRLPYVWDQYKRNGYITAFVEDLAIIGLFNYLKYGFLEKPTDFYPIPFWLSLYGHVEPGSAMTNETYYCFANVGAKVEIFLEQLFQFVHKMQLNKQPYFMYSFYSQVTHENFNNFQLIDEYIAKFVKRLEPFLENTIFIIMGDHGSRVGTFSYTPMGLIESRMPFFSIRIPEKLHNKHPHLRQVLNLNKDSLMSWFDIHKMLEDVAAGNYDFSREKILSPVNPMRYLVAPHRMCDHILIPKEYCICSAEFPVEDWEYSGSKKVIRTLESEIRKWTASCSQPNRTYLMQIILPTDNEEFNSVERVNITTTFTNNNSTVTAILKREKKHSKVWTKWFLDKDYENIHNVKQTVINKLCSTRSGMSDSDKQV